MQVGGPVEATKSQIKIDLERYQVPLQSDDLALGATDPLVTVVVYSNYACDPCRRSWDVMKHLLEHYGEDLRVVHRSVGIAGYVANDAAIEAAYAAGDQGKFWEMHWRLFEHARDLTRPAFRAHAEALGLDVPTFMSAIDDGVHSGRRLRDKRRQTELGVSAGPMSFVNGMLVVGFQPEDVWHAIIDKELGHMRKLLAAGTKRSDAYAASQKGAQPGPVAMDRKERELRAKKAKAKLQPASDKVFRAPDATKRYRIESMSSPGTGPLDAPVVAVEFTDFECPFCRRANAGVYAKLREKYAGKLRWVVRHFPLDFRRSAEPAARACHAAHAQGEILGVP